MKIFIVNLERCTERKTLMLEQFEKINIPVNFFPAVDGKECLLKWQNRTKTDAYNKLMGNSGFNLNNEIACFASHYCLWHLCVKNNENLLILEDDIGISPQFKVKLPWHPLT